MPNNPIRILPPSLFACTALTKLELNSCELQEITEAIGQLSDLQELYLRNNQLTSLPITMYKLTQLKRLDLNGNPGMTSPPPAIAFYQGIWDEEKLQRVATAVIEYFTQLHRTGGCTVRRMKWMVLGAQMAGKTSCIRTLMADTPSLTDHDERTLSLDIRTIPLFPPPDTHDPALLTGEGLEVFDFGGHQEYHVTYQLFIHPDRSLFTIFCPVDQDVDGDSIKQYVQSIAERAPGAVVQLVATKTDLCPDPHVLQHRVEAFYTAVVDTVEAMTVTLERQLERLRAIHTSASGGRGDEVGAKIEEMQRRLDKGMLRLPPSHHQVHPPSSSSTVYVCVTSHG